MADRCDHCSVRMDGLEVHALDCPVRAPEIHEENEALLGQIRDMGRDYRAKIEKLELQKGEALKSIEGAWSHIEEAWKVIEAVYTVEAIRQPVKEAWKCVRAAKESLSEKRKDESRGCSHVFDSYNNTDPNEMRIICRACGFIKLQ